MGTRSISQVDAAVLQEAVDREPFQQIEAITSRSQSPTSATKSAHRVIRGAATYSVAIGVTADIDRRDRSIARSRMTHKRHWLCNAAMVLMSISAPINVLV
jgi:hypothetical protein